MPRHPHSINLNLKSGNDYTRTICSAIASLSLIPERSRVGANDVILNALLYRFVRHSRRNETVLPERYASSRAGNRQRSGAIEKLEAAGFLKCTTGSMDLGTGEGLQSTFRATQQLLDDVDLALIVIAEKQPELIRLSRKVDGASAPVDYKDNQQTTEWRETQKRINAHNSGFAFTLQESVLETDLYRVFNSSAGAEPFTCDAGGGRHYGPVVNTPRADRPNVLIDGEQTAVADYKCLHPSIMYSLNGLCLSDELGQPDGYSPTSNTSPLQREVNKRLMLCAANAKGIRRAVEAARGKIQRDISKGKLSRDAADVALYSSYRALMAYHHKIADWLEAGRGTYFHWLDSQLITEVLLRCVERGIPAAPIHDAVLTKKSKIETVKKIMESVYLNTYNHKICVDITEGEKKEGRKEERNKNLSIRGRLSQRQRDAYPSVSETPIPTSARRLDFQRLTPRLSLVSGGAA
ncbi:MAG: hypothetical protein HN842_05985 [Gammaproteobacteria bacterium]|nr:hypothetical protein [Gammaproteobacteria bacterium]